MSLITRTLNGVRALAKWKHVYVPEEYSPILSIVFFPATVTPAQNTSSVYSQYFSLLSHPITKLYCIYKVYLFSLYNTKIANELKLRESHEIKIWCCIINWNFWIQKCIYVVSSYVRLLQWIFVVAGIDSEIVELQIQRRVSCFNIYNTHGLFSRWAET